MTIKLQTLVDGVPMMNSDPDELDCGPIGRNEQTAVEDNGALTSCKSIPVNNIGQNICFIWRTQDSHELFSCKESSSSRTYHTNAHHRTAVICKLRASATSC